jgi:hypothetical protein
MGKYRLTMTIQHSNYFFAKIPFHDESNHCDPLVQQDSFDFPFLGSKLHSL